MDIIGPKVSPIRYSLQKPRNVLTSRGPHFTLSTIMSHVCDRL